MDNNNKGLFDLLEMQLEACERLGKAMEDKQRVILDGDAAALDDMVKAETKLIEEISLRAAMIEELAEADTDERCRLMQERIGASFIELKEMNDVNRNLLKDQLAVTRSILDVVVSMQPTNAYDSNGNKNNRKSQMVKILDQRI